MGKFPGLHQILLELEIIQKDSVIEPREADWADLLTVHTPSYLSMLAEGQLSRGAERRMGLPWSQQLVQRSRIAVQGTINAAMMALEEGMAGNLAGGTHHAYPDHGEGFCVLNDVAVAIRLLQRSRWIRRALVVDLDVHQGNGTAAIFADDPSVFTFSMHGAKNYPFHKEASDIDVPLPDKLEDAGYLDLLRNHLPIALEKSRPDLVFYLAGVDVLRGDRFGRMALTPQGLALRDRFVIDAVRGAGLPLTLLLSGGYASSPQETASMHAVVYQEAVRFIDGQQRSEVASKGPL